MHHNNNPSYKQFLLSSRRKPTFETSNIYTVTVLFPASDLSDIIPGYYEIYCLLIPVRTVATAVKAMCQYGASAQTSFDRKIDLWFLVLLVTGTLQF
jgi:hypothetical protein